MTYVWCSNYIELIVSSSKMSGYSIEIWGWEVMFLLQSYNAALPSSRDRWALYGPACACPSDLAEFSLGYNSSKSLYVRTYSPCIFVFCCDSVYLLFPLVLCFTLYIFSGIVPLQLVRRVSFIF